MAKSIKSRKNKDKGYSFLISANLNQKKLIKNIEKSVLSSLNNKDSFVPLSNLTITVDGIKKTAPNYWKTATILLLLITTIGLIFLFKFFTYENLSPVAQKPTPEIIFITPNPTATPIPKEINRKLNILILNASRFQGIALNLKKNLTQNKFENVTIGNNKQTIEPVLIEYKPGCEFEAKYLKENYLGLSSAILSEIKNTNPSIDIIITLGKSYISK